ncbi:MAG: DUF2855 family protein [Caulobacter sp.]|nr:DUF2855 family protein [Caulobacter sp.]
MTRWDLLIDKSDLTRTQVAPSQAPQAADLAEGQVLLAVERFAVTANNVTYGAMGDAFGYWKFFPAPDGFGRVPVCGFARVEASRAEGIDPGLRLVGYLPMSSHFVADLVRTRGGLVDAAPHRAQLPPTYNQYAEAPDPAASDDHRALLRPLFGTSWLIDDFLEEAGDFGAKTVILTSASSKTALGLAYRLQQRGVAVVGLTSPRNIAFLKGLGWFAAVAAYDEIETVAVETPVVIVDFAGDADVVGRLHRRFGDAIAHSAIVGATHWEAPPDGAALPGPARALFFAPDQIRKRFAEWGAEDFDRRFTANLAAFIAASPWLKLRTLSGADGAVQAWDETVHGRAAPDTGLIVEL